MEVSAMVEKFVKGEAIILCPNCDNEFRVVAKGGRFHYTECFSCKYLPEVNEIREEAEKALEEKSELWDVLVVCPANNEVICDLCNAEVGPEEEGGCFVGSYAVCPECTKKKSKEFLKEAELVEGCFVKAVLQKRNQDFFGIYDSRL
jgi:ssDNA-binding Zn-finger/Zn-ribbon topoisomerase 1